MQSRGNQQNGTLVGKISSPFSCFFFRLALTQGQKRAPWTSPMRKKCRACVVFIGDIFPAFQARRKKQRQNLWSTPSCSNSIRCYGAFSTERAHRACRQGNRKSTILTSRNAYPPWCGCSKSFERDRCQRKHKLQSAGAGEGSVFFAIVGNRR